MPLHQDRGHMTMRMLRLQYNNNNSDPIKVATIFFLLDIYYRLLYSLL